jgi:hypothetical protein
MEGMFYNCKALTNLFILNKLPKKKSYNW